MAEAAARQQTVETLAKFYDGKLRLERRNSSPKISPAHIRHSEKGHRFHSAGPASCQAHRKMPP
jgi:hypothetical protein